MDRNGFYPKGITCERCGVELSGEDGPRPAETYAGTFTGLCTKCMNEKPYVVKEHFDGAITRSYAPSCPSHRRERELFTGYPDCPDCGGSGRKYHTRPMMLGGGSYYGYCEACSDRRRNHPIRMAHRESLKVLRDIGDKWDKEFHKHLKAEGISIRNVEMNDEQANKAYHIAEELRGPAKEERKRAEDQIYPAYEKAKTMKTPQAVKHIEKIRKEVVSWANL